MLRYLCIIAVLSSPLACYTFATYPNIYSESSSGNSYSVGTKGLNDTHIRIYVQVTLTNPSTSCLMLAFGATSQFFWSGADVLAINLATSGDIVRLGDLTGTTGTYSVKGGETSQDWKFVQTGADPSFTYDGNGSWKAEITRAYARNEFGNDIDIVSPSGGGSTSVAVNVFKDACPTGQFSYFFNVLGGYSFSSLKPTKSGLIIQLSAALILTVGALLN